MKQLDISEMEVESVQRPRTRSNTVEEKKSAQNSEDDVITLTGCGQITRYKFVSYIF